MPKKTFSSSHIGCICLSYQIIGSKDSKIYKHYFVVDREYKIISDYEQHIYHTEQEMCLGFLNFVVNLQESTMPIFLLGYNSSVSLNDCECGYDFPFIYARSNIQQDIITQSLRLKKDENENIKTESMMIRGLKGISNLYLIDMLWAMNN